MSSCLKVAHANRKQCICWKVLRCSLHRGENFLALYHDGQWAGQQMCEGREGLGQPLAQSWDDPQRSSGYFHKGSLRKNVCIILRYDCGALYCQTIHQSSKVPSKINHELRQHLVWWRIIQESSKNVSDKNPWMKGRPGLGRSASSNVPHGTNSYTKISSPSSSQYPMRVATFTWYIRDITDTCDPVSSLSSSAPFVGVKW